MKKKALITCLISLLLSLGCVQSKKDLAPELWIGKMHVEWPSFVLTNTIEFADTTFHDLGNGFLIETGTDTLAVTCKHLFMVFRNHGLSNSIDPGENFVQWKMYPKGQRNKEVIAGTLLNRDPREEIGDFNTLKVRDWLVFEIKQMNSHIYPLKISNKALRKNDVVYALGWAQKQNTVNPSLVKMRVYRNLGPIAYVQSLSKGVDPCGRSGSPVIDKNGHLVGLVSGAEGNLGVVATTAYLQDLLTQYLMAKP